jgi:chondroitin AC lyase
MLRGRYTVPSTIDRLVARPGTLGPIDLSIAASQLAGIDPRNADQLGRVANAKGLLISEGHRHFPVADFTTYHRPGFSFFLKTTSERTERAETINGENLGGAAMMGQGDAYLMRSGEEYFDMMPCWDWNMLPGTTFVPNARERVRNAFTGGVSDGISGLTVMDYEFGSPRLGLRCRKFWAAHGDRIVCLIGGVTAPGNDDPGLLLAGGTHPYGLFTALDQTRQCGEVTVGFEDGSQGTGKNGDMSGVSWIHHNHFVHVLLQPSRIQLRLGEVSGSWAKISLSGSSEPVRMKRFLPVLRHGTEDVGYVMAPAQTPQEALQIARETGVDILRNDSGIQSVRFADGITMTAVYQPGLQDPSSPVRVDQSCLLLQKCQSVFLSDPGQEGKIVRVTCAKSQSDSISLPPNGSTVHFELK